MERFKSSMYRLDKIMLGESNLEQMWKRIHIVAVFLKRKKTWMDFIPVKMFGWREKKEKQKTILTVSKKKRFFAIV